MENWERKLKFELLRKPPQKNSENTNKKIVKVGFSASRSGYPIKMIIQIWQISVITWPSRLIRNSDFGKGSRSPGGNSGKEGNRDSRREERKDEEYER